MQKETVVRTLKKTYNLFLSDSLYHMAIKMNYAEKAENLFRDGYNCSQSVLLAFSDVIGIDDELAKKISIGLGGGVGRLREVCGAVTASAMVLGALYSGDDGRNRGSAYEKVQKFAEAFQKENGSIVCREILGIDKSKKESAQPAERTEQYYKTRPCAKKIYNAAKIVEKMISENESKYTFING